MKYLWSVGMATLFLFSVMTQSHAALITYMNGPGDPGRITGGAFGNTDTRIATDGTSVEVSAWSFNRRPASRRWRSAELREYSFGLGTCNRNEGLHSPLGSCTSFQAEHSTDNRRNRRRDFILFEFSQLVELEEAIVTAWNTGNNGSDPGPRKADSDVSYWGNTGAIPDFSNTGLGFLGTRVNDNGPNRFSGQSRTIDLSGLPAVNWLLIGARVNHNDDGIKLKSLEFTAVPIPNSALLLGTGLLGFIAIARRKHFLKK